MVKLLSESAPAKINLYLRVTGRRADGYHELDSIFIPVALCDRVQIEMRPSAARSVTLQCDARTLPVDQGNLAFRAAAAFMAEFDIDAQVLIDLDKEIPIGGGLGGGSSDAGAVLRMLAAMSRVRDSARLAVVALKLGADVPFFLNPVPARVGGIGERIVPLEWVPKFHIVIAAPPIEVSTAEVFRHLERQQWSGPASAADVGRLLQGHIPPALLVNDLAPVAMKKWPVIAQLRVMLERAGASAAAMTGSGGAVFGIFPTADAAERAVLSVGALVPETRVFSVGPYQFPA